jgi:glycosyltransferase involved in cell wall biosynthesis
VAEELRRWMNANGGAHAAGFLIDCIPAGADIAASLPTRGLPYDAEALLARLRAEPSVLMVGTLEPRKRYLQALIAFTQLWREGSRLVLVIVGRPGWQDLPVEQQRDIPELINALRAHPERGRRLIWLDGVSDEFLERVYSAARGLLAASQSEGFGLPLVEAARSGLPILARDIPVFREVAGEQASYFTAETADELARAVSDWAARDFGPPPGPSQSWASWKDSAGRLAEIFFPGPRGVPVVKG